MNANKRQPLFYEIHPEKAQRLAREQIADGWSKEEIRNYFCALGYDIFFFNVLWRDIEAQSFFGV